jgi:DNA-binding transcriptional LysR family regulator
MQVPVKGPLRSNNLSALLAAARGDLGLAALPWYVAHESVREGVVVPVLGDWTLPSQPIHAVYPSPRLVPTKVSGFVTWLEGQFPESWWSRLQ